MDGAHLNREEDAKQHQERLAANKSEVRNPIEASLQAKAKKRQADLVENGDEQEDRLMLAVARGVVVEISS